MCLQFLFQFHGNYYFIYPVFQNDLILDLQGQHTVTHGIGMLYQPIVLKVKSHAGLKTGAQILFIREMPQRPFHDQSIPRLAVSPRKHDVFKIIRRIVCRISVLLDQYFGRNLPHIYCRQ